MNYIINHYINNQNIHNIYFEANITVSINKEIDNIQILKQNKILIDNPDWNILSNEQIVFDEKRYNKYIKQMNVFINNNFIAQTNNETERKRIKENFNLSSFFLKNEIIQWLNDNIDNKEQQNWTTGNQEFNFKNHNTIFVFFKKQEDALMFIEKWSVFKKPTFYFDFFNNDKREISINDLNKFIDFKFEKKIQTQQNISKINTNMDKETFLLNDFDN